MSVKVVERSALVSFTPAQMFALVDDVPRYPEFLPWCVGAQSTLTSADERVATVQVARGPLRTEFTTRNTLQPGAAIDMALVKGPFRRLVGQWRFEGVGPAAEVKGSRIRFRVEFEFNNGLMAAALGSVFESVCSSVVDAFVARARTLYA